MQLLDSSLNCLLLLETVLQNYIIYTADILVPNWMIGKPAAFDLTVVSPLNSATLNEAGARSGSAAGKAEVHAQAQCQ